MTLSEDSSMAFQKNTFHDKPVVQKNLIQSLERLEAELNKIDLALCGDGRTYLHKDSYQLIAQRLRPEKNNSWERMLFQELLQTCYKLELKCHRSSSMFLRAFISFARALIKNNEENGSTNARLLIEHNQKEGDKYLARILQTCYPASVKDIDGLIDSVAEDDDVVSTVVKEAIRLAGIEGNIVLDSSGRDQQNIVVELQFGYNFKVSPFKGFLNPMSAWTRNNVKVLLIDGLVEKVSELDKILMKSFDTKVPLMIVAQGFSEEVVATLYSNDTRGAFDILPVRTEQSLEALNMLNDIAAVSGCDVVNTLKGEMLIYVDYDALPIVEKASIASEVLTVHNSKTRENVLAHLNYLNKRRKGQQEENPTVSDVSNLTTKRIQNLMAHLVKITIPKSEAGKLLGTIDNSLRACRTAFTYGFCKPKEINLDGLSKEWKLAHEAMTKNKEEKNVSSVGLYLSGRYGANLAGSYFTAAGAVVNLPEQS